MSSNPGNVYWMDFLAFICCKNCDVCLKTTKINEKEARVFKKRHAIWSLEISVKLGSFVNFQSPPTPRCVWTVKTLLERLLRQIRLS